MNGLVTLFLCGDVMTGRGIDQALPWPGDPKLYEPSVDDATEYVKLAEQASGPLPRPLGFAYVWGDALEVFEREKPRAKIINLETAITRSEMHWPSKHVHYKMNPANIACLTAAGIDCCTLANNHTLDWGMAGLLETLDTLDFKTFAGSERYVFRPTSLAKVAAETMTVEGPNYAARGIQVEQAIPVDLPLIMADADKLKQVVLNLCKNAVEAMPQGGTLTLRAHHSGENVILEVIDTGVGVPANLDLLTPFATTKSSGTALGLIIVRQIISMQKEHLAYSREEDKQTVFRLTLPRFKSEAVTS
jgi:hypothetical protein